MGGKRHVPINELRKFRQSFVRVLTNDNAYFDRHAIPPEILQSNHRLIKGAACLDNMVMLDVVIRIERNTNHQIWMSKPRQLFCERPVIKQPAVRQNMQSSSRQRITTGTNQFE